MTRAVPLNILHRTPRTLPHPPPEVAEKLRTWRGMRGERKARAPEEGPKHLSVPNSVELKFTSFPRICFPLMLMCCEVIIWAKFCHFRCYYLGQVGVIIWAKLFLAYKNSGFKRFFAHTVII